MRNLRSATKRTWKTQGVFRFTKQNLVSVGRDLTASAERCARRKKPSEKKSSVEMIIVTSSQTPEEILLCSVFSMCNMSSMHSVFLCIMYPP